METPDPYIISLEHKKKGLQIAMASGWESEGLGLEIGRLQATFDPGLPKN